MAKKAVYAPGELDRVRDKLGDLDADEARELAKKLGGEVGYERTEEEEESRQHNRRARSGKAGIGQPGRRVEILQEFDLEDEKPGKKRFDRLSGLDPADDPSIPVKIGYWERIKMDRFAGQPQFEIKSPTQVFISIISLFSEVIDYVSPVFVTRRMPEYYKRIETLVVSTRNMLPRNNFKRNERMKKTAPLAYSILDVIRYWDIEKISGDLAKIQARPKGVRAGEFADILRMIYKPLFILARLNLDAHIRGAYKVLYKLLYIESPSEAKNKYQEMIRSALTAYSGVYKDISFLLYPLLMKLISPSYLSYDLFFGLRKNRYMAFLGVTEDSQIKPDVMNVQTDAGDSDSGAEQSAQDEETAHASDAPEAEAGSEQGAAQDKPKEEEISPEEKEKRASEEAEKKALERGLNTLEMLFPKAGWDRPSTYPDFYPYFVGIFDLKKGIINIAPTDPMQQIYILMRTMEELFFGLRYVKFGSVPASGGNTERVDAVLGEIINNWHYYIDLSFEREYLPRLSEYVRILEGPIEERNSQYTKRIITELHWVKRFYLLPFYKFESLVPPTLQKKDSVAIYAKIRTLRKYLAAVATGIEYGNKAGGSEAGTKCDGIENPWEPYAFQVPNPVSIRIDAILAGVKIKTNASLVYFCLAVATVLDHLLNSEKSWAYSIPSTPLFRSVNGEGTTPLIGVDDKIDADAIFKQALRQRQRSNAK